MSENHTVVFNSLWPHGLYSPWKSPDQNTGVGSRSRGSSQQRLNPGLPHCSQTLHQLRHQGNPRMLEWVAIPSLEDLPKAEIETRAPTLQVDSLRQSYQGRPTGGRLEHWFTSYADRLSWELFNARSFQMQNWSLPPATHIFPSYLPKTFHLGSLGGKKKQMRNFWQA